MKDHIFVGEFRKRVSVLESQFEALKRDLDAARTALAMFERASAHNFQAAGNLTQAEIIADIAIDALSHNNEMHRGDILDTVVSKGVHVGYDDDRRKQLSGLSTLLSKDARFRPVTGRSGYWTLARTDKGWPDSSDDSDEVSWESGFPELEPCDVEKDIQENVLMPCNGKTQVSGDIFSHRSGLVVEGDFRQEG